MSSARDTAMAAMTASIDGYQISDLDNDAQNEDVQLDEAATVQSNKDLIEAERLKQAQIKTDADIHRLEEAKRKASSDAVKAEMDEEIRRVKAAKQQKEEEDEQGIGPLDLLQNTSDRAWKTIDRVQDVAGQAWDGLSRATTPGTIFLPVTVLLVFFFLLLPVNGHTRAQWLWLTLTGAAHLSGETAGSTPTGSTQSTTPVTPFVSTQPPIPGSNFTGVAL